jgi:2-hydroxychromene-2-carboxylate isomerase
MSDLTFYYDFASPFSYLASTQIERVAAEGHAQIIWKPILVGALFRNIGTPNVPLDAQPAAKRAYYVRDIMHWASHWGVPVSWPSRFPMRTVAPLRLALAAGERLPAATRAIFDAYWVRDRDIADRQVLAAIAGELALPPEVLDRALAPDPAVKQALVDNTAEAERTGVFGVPSFLVRGHLFWGQDRLDLVSRVLAGWEPPAL